MPPRDADAIRRWAREHTPDLRIDLVRVSGHPALAAVEGFAGALAELVPSLRIRRETDEYVSQPGLRLAPNLIFHAAPAGTQIAPFLDALALSAGLVPAPLSDEQAGALAQVCTPAQLDLYVGAHCPFCPSMIGRLTALAAAAPSLALAVIDAGLFAESAGKDGIQSVPTLILDGGLRWTGAVEIQSLVPALVDRDPARLPAAVLERMLESGAAGDLAGMMAEAGQIFPALIDLILHPRWSVRLGAMVAVETLVELDADLAFGTAPLLLERYSAQPVNVRGDVLQVLGMVGSADTISRISALVEDEADAEVRAAAEEAVAEILERSNG